MKLGDVLVRDATVYELAPGAKEEILRQMLEAVARAGRIEKAQIEELCEALMRRERLGTTGIGKGIAVPHAKHAAVQGILAVLGHSSAGVSFNSLDSAPVHTIFMLLASPNVTGDHLAVLEKISAIVRDDDYWRFLRDAKSAGEMHEIIAEADSAFG